MGEHGCRPEYVRKVSAVSNGAEDALRVVRHALRAARHAAPAALTVVGLVALVVGAWFSIHLGSSGSATFRARPAGGGVVVLTPSVLNRVDDRVSVTARADDGAQVWVGRATPSDVDALVGSAEHVVVDGVRVGSWSLTQHTDGVSAAAPPLADADIWRQTTTAKGSVRVEVDQANAPESLVVSAATGELSSVRLTVERGTWFFQSLLVTLVGAIATVAGVVGLVTQVRRARRAGDAAEPDDSSAELDATEVTA